MLARDMVTRIFLSYARDDNLLPPGLDNGRLGFVNSLFDNLTYKFRDLGVDPPILWRDTRNIDRSDQFEPMIRNEIDRSDLFLVVLSKNWIRREFCRRELEWFQNRWAHEDVRRRIVIAARQFIPYEARLPALQGQEGFEFFGRDPGGHVGDEYAYFDLGQVRDQRYYAVIAELARKLCSFSQSSDETAAAGQSPSRAGAQLTSPQAGAAAAPTGNAVAVPDRVVYLAKPAADMRSSYERLVQELRGRDYSVVPPPDVEIPNDSTAAEMVDQSLAGAGVAIHLLGDKAGYAPEDCEPIVKLQLSRSAARIEKFAARDCSAREKGFHRLIWAPKVLVDSASGLGSGSERDPIDVLAKFGRQTETDKIVGDPLSRFVDFMIENLDRAAAEAEAPPEIEALADGAQVYVYHQVEDSEYAYQIMRALQQRHVQVDYPTFDGTPAEIKQAHERALRECSSIVIAWANASATWVKNIMPDFRDWRKWGRSEDFGARVLVTGPPPGMKKKIVVDIPPRRDIDVVLDLTDRDRLETKDLDALNLASGLART
jgi:hypothetical protein